MTVMARKNQSLLGVAGGDCVDNIGGGESPLRALVPPKVARRSCVASHSIVVAVVEMTRHVEELRRTVVGANGEIVERFSEGIPAARRAIVVVVAASLCIAAVENVRVVH